MRELIERMDIDLLHLFNVRWGNPSLDQFWIAVSHLQQQFWFSYIVAPSLLMILFYIYGWRAFRPLIMTAVTVGIADAIAYRLIKVAIDRPRPFENPEIAGWLRHIGEAHGPSFPSNHATNCFAAAVILAWYFPEWVRLIYAFALLVAYSRIALGVHYPSDVLAGIILGYTVGTVVKMLLLNRIRALRIRKPVSKPETDSDDWRLRSRRLADD